MAKFDCPPPNKRKQMAFPNSATQTRLQIHLNKCHAIDSRYTCIFVNAANLISNLVFGLHSPLIDWVVSRESASSVAVKAAPISLVCQIVLAHIFFFSLVLISAKRKKSWPPLLTVRPYFSSFFCNTKLFFIKKFNRNFFFSFQVVHVKRIHKKSPLNLVNLVDSFTWFKVNI